MLDEHFGEWVAYHLDQRVGFSTSKTRLYQECLSRGTPRGEFIVRRVVPDVPRIMDERPV
ncbi:MAG TPA: hypothetical protein VFI31_23725 [Pirellulales bacterium]|nr:hypothetical protein [Pirellulales bacterium]